MNTEERHEWKRLNEELQNTMTELNHFKTNSHVLKVKGLKDYNAVRKSGLLEKRKEKIDTEIELFSRKHFTNNT